MHHAEIDHEAGADVRFGLAYERLRAEDEATNAWLDKACRRAIDPDEREMVVIEPKPGRPRTNGFCLVRCCNRKARAKGMCDRHYRAARRQGLTQAEFRRRMAEAA